MKISSFVKSIITLFIILSAGIISLGYILVNQLNESKAVLAGQVRYVQQSQKLTEVKNFLSTQARAYVLYGENKYYENYLSEVNNTKTRDVILSNLRTLGLSKDEEAQINKVMEISNTMVEVELESLNLYKNEHAIVKARNNLFSDNYSNLETEFENSLSTFQSALLSRVQNDVDTQWQNAMLILYACLGAMGIMFLVTVVSLLKILKKIKPINHLITASNEIAEGNLNVNFMSTSNDEIGSVYQAFIKITNTLKMIIDDLNDMTREHAEGNYFYAMEVEKYAGSYQDMVAKVNSMADSYVGYLTEAIKIMGEFESGNFHAEMKQFPGKLATANRTIDNFREKLIEINSEINALSAAALEGDLSANAKTEGFEGDWLIMVENLNRFVDAVGEPIREAIGVFKNVSTGDLSVSVEGDYKGDFYMMKEAINLTIESLSSYITEISRVLSTMARSDFNVSVDMDFKGDFAEIKDSITMINESLNGVVRNVLLAASEVNSGAKHISESSTRLAEGATEQATTIQDINLSIEVINKMAKVNADSAKDANNLAEASMENAEAGKQEMSRMLTAMNQIKESSNNIAKIIKVIDDIAFQTNILALNASVEAARAGQHGRGFAVVAEEVGNLAGRSQNAAKETQMLIDDTINKINDGTKIAESTSNALGTIVSNVNNVSKLISNIYASSEDQEEGINKLNDGINQMTAVVQANSATSEESAAASEELFSQSEMLNGLLKEFVLKESEE